MQPGAALVHTARVFTGETCNIMFMLPDVCVASFVHVSTQRQSSGFLRSECAHNYSYADAIMQFPCRCMMEHLIRTPQRLCQELVRPPHYHSRTKHITQAAHHTTILIQRPWPMQAQQGSLLPRSRWLQFRAGVPELWPYSRNVSHLRTWQGTFSTSRPHQTMMMSTSHLSNVCQNGAQAPSPLHGKT